MGRALAARDIASRTSLLSCLALACAAPAALPAPTAARAVSTAATTPRGSGDSFDFPEQAASPLSLPTIPEDLRPLYALCPFGDAALSRVAQRFAQRKSVNSQPLDVPELSFALRAEGAPYVWPRAWTLEAADLENAAAGLRLQGWLDSFNDGGERRCGLALVQGPERDVLAAVAVDALADLAPLRLRERAGAWVDVDARMLVPTNAAKFIVLGPSGAPYALPTSFDGQRARARFRADRPGAFLIQLLADVAGGPRPVLEATIYADIEPPSSFFSDPAPGEPSQLSPDDDSAQALFEMLNAARASEQSPALERDAALDAVAQRHAEAMRQLGRVAHDAGHGTPRSRVAAAYPGALATGENVAHALDVRRAHRLLWASPSHRENLLQPRFDKVGIGIAVDPDGSIWVCEVFADLAGDRPRPR